MKKTILFFSVIATCMSFVACSNENDLLVEQPEQNLPQNDKMTFWATGEACTGDETDAKVTRTQYDGTSVVWSKDDVIYIDNNKYTLVSGDGTGDAQFSGVQLDYTHGSGWLSRDQAKTYTAYYGFDAPNNYSFPEVQEYNSKNVSYVPMQASITVKTDYSIQQDLIEFKNLCGLLRITLRDNSRRISKIQVTAAEAMAGKINTTISNNSLSISGTSKSITLDCGENGVALSSKGTDFYIAMPVKNYSSFAIKITDSNRNSVTKRLKSGTLSIVRSQITPVTLTNPFVTSVGEYNDHEWVDLGLPSGFKWAKKNVGADVETDNGQYFAWGEIQNKTNYVWTTYKWGTQSSSMTKYNSTDGVTILESADDVATQQWGDKWRMPTKADMLELLQNCYWEATAKTAKIQGWYVYRAKRNADGTLVKNGDKNVKDDSSSAYIFLPCAQYMSGTNKLGQSYGTYWTSSVDENDNSKAYLYRFASSSVSETFTTYERYYGLTVRPVLKEQ